MPRYPHLGQSHRTAPSTCLECGYEFSGATPVDHESRAYPGAITVCINCGHIMAFALDMTMRPLTDEEARDIAGAPQVLGAVATVGLFKQYAAWRKREGR